MPKENIIHCVQDVHVKELVKRLDWSVKIRWYYIFVSSFLILCVYWMFNGHAIRLRYDYLIGANIFLFLCNSLYQYQLRYSYDKCLGTHELRLYLMLQIISDYLALTFVVYALGSIETPILIMIIPNSILSTLFFTPRQSLMITLSGLTLVMMPLLMEYFNMIPIISIYEHSFKTVLFSDFAIFSGFLFILYACIIFCWYLLSSITSQLIRNELVLEQSYQDMLKLDEEKTQATLRSTHELKAPLAAIKSYIYSIQAGYAGDINEKIQKIVERIGKRCDYLLDNVTDIIKLGNLKSYVVSEHRFHPVNLLAFLEKFLPGMNALTAEKHINIHLYNQQNNVNKTIMATEDNLQLIFSNLITNAINYSHDNGKIDIVLNDVVFNGRNCVCVSIEDQGIGIAAEHIDKIFQEHFRTNEAVAFYEGGTGLGLSIVQVCCRILDAQLQINSSPGQGTVVKVYFCISDKE